MELWIKILRMSLGNIKVIEYNAFEKLQKENETLHKECLDFVFKTQKLERYLNELGQETEFLKSRIRNILDE